MVTCSCRPRTSQHLRRSDRGGRPLRRIEPLSHRQHLERARAGDRARIDAARGREDIDLQARLGYTFLDTNILAVDAAAAAPPPFRPGDPLLRRPRHQWSFDVMAVRGPLTAWVRGGGRGHVLDVEPTLGTFGGLFDAAGFAVGTWAGAGPSSGASSCSAASRISSIDRTRRRSASRRSAGARWRGIRVAAGR